MRRLAMLAGAVCALFSATAGYGKNEGTQPPQAPKILSRDGTIVALGDSLTAGYGVHRKEAYPAQLERKLHHAGYQWRVVNAGISGETSSDALARLDRILRLEPDVVILEIGGNDGLRRVDPQIIRRNIERMVQIMRGRDITVVLAGMKIFPYLGKEYTEAFAALYRDVAAKYHLVLVPFFLTGVGGNAALNQEDGIHPIAEGYRMITANIFPYVVEAITRTTEAREVTALVAVGDNALAVAVPEGSS